MAEIIDFAEIQAARRRSNARAPEREHIERAIYHFKRNLADAADDLIDSSPAESRELLSRIENLTALIRYATRMLGDAAAPDSIPQTGSR